MNNLIGLADVKGIDALREFLLDCPYISSSEMEDITERLCLVKENHCVFCGKVLDVDTDNENSCKECE